MNTETLKSEIARYLASERETDLIEGVKDVVRREIFALDPNVKIADTHTFNHSYNPDFIVEWSDQGPTRARKVFLRFDLRSVYAGEDLRRLDPGSMFVGIREGVEDRQVDPYRAELEDESNGSLLTDTSALNTFSLQADAPMMGILGANVVRGAQGVVDSPAAEAITGVVGSDWGQGPEGRAEYLGLINTVGQHFSPDAALRLKRTAQILWMGTTGDLSPLDGEDGLVLGQLSDVELRTLVPYLLKQPQTAQHLGFWRHIGTMLTLRRLLDLAPDLLGIDINPFVVANTDRLSAKRVKWVVDMEEQVLPTWSITRNALRLKTRFGVVLFGLDGRALKAEEDARVPSWEDVAAAFSLYRMDEVSLAGIARKWTVTSEDNSSVLEDCRRLAEGTDERLFVPRAVLTLPAQLERNPSFTVLDLAHEVADVKPQETVGLLAYALLPYLALRTGQQYEAKDLESAFYSE
jgi:hypothetical protein